MREGHSPIIPLTDLHPSLTNPAICIYQSLNHTHSFHLPQRQTWHMVSLFNFSNHIVLCHLAHPHESIPSPRSSQCRTPPMACPNKPIPSPRYSQCRTPHGAPLQINSIAPIQSHAPMARPHKSIPPPRSSQCRAPYGVPPQINSIAPIQSRAHHHPNPASVVCPHGTPPINQSHRSVQPVSNSHWNIYHISYITFLEVPIMDSPDPGSSPDLSLTLVLTVTLFLTLTRLYEVLLIAALRL